MNPLRLLLLPMLAVLSVTSFAADVDAGLAAVRDLGGINGTVLACSDMKSAARARELMLAHAPKTPRFGAAYEEATQAGFAEQTRAGKPCPGALEVTDQLNRLAVRLADTLPATK